MKDTPRKYQQEAVDRGIAFFKGNTNGHEIQVLCTAAGKSHIIAWTVEGLNEPTLILQPSKEILKQNYSKFIACGAHASMFSASVGQKEVSKVTYASLASIMSKNRDGEQKNLHKFLHFRNIIIDEAHLNSNSKEGQLVDFLTMLDNPRVLGLTATPFRLYPYTARNGTRDSMLKFLTRTRPRIFSKVNYHVQIDEIKKQGFLAHLRYFPQTKVLDHLFNRKVIKVNSTGADYDENSLREYYKTTDFNRDVVNVVKRVNKAGRRCLVFVSFVEDANEISLMLGKGSATVNGKTKRKEREQIELDFKEGILDSVINVGCWTTGFDDPRLGCVVIAKPMRSLAVYYQMFGRGLRIHPKKKDCWAIDLCGNMEMFGRVEDLRVEFTQTGLPMITGSGGKKLTGVPLTEIN